MHNSLSEQLLISIKPFPALVKSTSFLPETVAKTINAKGDGNSNFTHQLPLDMSLSMFPADFAGYKTEEALVLPLSSLI